eukprot:4564464-Prymnesium_polylepis.1
MEPHPQLPRLVAQYGLGRRALREPLQAQDDAQDGAEQSAAAERARSDQRGRRRRAQAATRRGRRRSPAAQRGGRGLPAHSRPAGGLRDVWLARRVNRLARVRRGASMCM